MIMFSLQEMYLSEKERDKKLLI